jgi:nucleoside-diphosphate-sugar epimerase
MILVTGGAGFIGRQVCSLLLAHGKDVVAVDRNFVPGLSCPTVQGDLSSNDFLAELFRKYSFDTIIHLASLLNTASRQQPHEAMRVNVGISLSLLKLAVQFNVLKFIYSSSIAVYGSKRYSEYGEVSESDPASPEDVYGVSKRYVEIAGENYRQHNNIQFIALRISTVVGTGAANTSSKWRSEIFEKLKVNHLAQISIPYRADEMIPLIHVEDVAEMTRRLVDAGQVSHATYNTPSENWKCSDLADYIESLNNNIKFTFGHSSADGFPQAINGRRFADEFVFSPIQLKERLHRVIKDGGS